MNLSRWIFPAFLVVAAVSGCDNAQQSPTPAPEAISENGFPQSEPQDMPPQPGAVDALPEGISIDLVHRVGSDRTEVKGDATPRRRVRMEYTGVDRDAAVSSVEQSLLDAGFEAKERSELDNGNIRAGFSKRGFGSIFVIVTPATRAAGDGDLQGRMTLDLPAGK